MVKLQDKTILKGDERHLDVVVGRDKDDDIVFETDDPDLEYLNVVFLSPAQTKQLKDYLDKMKTENIEHLKQAEIDIIDT